jgi:hypothetical protein
MRRAGEVGLRPLNATLNRHRFARIAILVATLTVFGSDRFEENLISSAFFGFVFSIFAGDFGRPLLPASL